MEPTGNIKQAYNYELNTEIQNFEKKEDAIGSIFTSTINKQKEELNSFLPPKNPIDIGLQTTKKMKTYLNEVDVKMPEKPIDEYSQSLESSEDQKIVKKLEELQIKQKASFKNITENLNKIYQKIDSIYSQKESERNEIFKLFAQIVDDITDGEIDPTDLAEINENKDLIEIKKFFEKLMNREETAEKKIFAKCIRYLDFIDHLLEVHSCSCFSAKITEEWAEIALKNRKDILPKELWKSGSFRFSLCKYILDNYRDCNPNIEKQVFLLRPSGSNPGLLNSDKTPMHSEIYYTITVSDRGGNYTILYDLDKKKWFFTQEGKTYLESSALDSLFTKFFSPRAVKIDAVPVDCISPTLLSTLKLGVDQHNNMKLYKQIFVNIDE